MEPVLKILLSHALHSVEVEILFMQEHRQGIWCLKDQLENWLNLQTVRVHCFCDNVLNPTLNQKIEGSKCNRACRGNITQMCGGVWANAIYETGLEGNDLYLKVDDAINLSKL